MQLGLRAVLLVVAIILFIIAAISNGDTAFNFLTLGLGLRTRGGGAWSGWSRTDLGRSPRRRLALVVLLPTGAGQASLR